MNLGLVNSDFATAFLLLVSRDRAKIFKDLETYLQKRYRSQIEGKKRCQNILRYEMHVDDVIEQDIVEDFQMLSWPVATKFMSILTVK